MTKRFDMYKAAIERSGIRDALAASQRFDANETAVFARQLEDIDAQLYQVLYPELKGTLLVPVKSNINPGAEEYTYRSIDHAGAAQRISNYADDIPRVDTQGTESTSKIASYGASYGYSIQDLRRASMANLALEDERAKAARHAVAIKVNDVVWTGDSAKSITGFANNAGVSLVSPTTGTWSTATALQIVDDVRKLENTIFSDSKGIEMPDTLVLAQTSYVHLSKPIGDNADKTVLMFLLANLSHIRAIEFAYELNLADAEGDGPRAIAYKRSEEKLCALLPVEFEAFPPQARNLSFEINCHARCGGTVFRYPGSARYMDGL